MTRKEAIEVLRRLPIGLGEKGIRDVKRTLKDYGIDVEVMEDENRTD